MDTCSIIESDLSINVNFYVSPAELMQIDIRPTDVLAPVRDLPASRNPARVYLASLANGSQPTMLGALNLSAYILSGGQCDHASCPWWLLRKAHTNALRAWLAQNRAYATGNKILAAVRGTLRAAWDMELIDTDAYMRAISIKRIKGERPAQATGRALSAGEIAAILGACAADPTPAGARDAAILGLGVRGGLRRAEIAELNAEDYDATAGMLTVRGKGNKTRTVPVAHGVDAALLDWLKTRGNEHGGLFCAVNKAGRITGEPISGSAVYDALAKRAVAAGVRKFTPHDLRRTFAGDMLDAGADIATVQKLMGHANSNTTSGYDRRGERAKREAIGRLHFAWTPRG